MLMPRTSSGTAAHHCLVSIELTELIEKHYCPAATIVRFFSIAFD